MRTLFFLLFMLALLIGVPHIAHAQINACIGAHGERVYTDQPCGGSSVPASGVNANAVDESGSVTDYLNASCPGSPQALRERVISAFDRDDPNVLAGVLLWGGVDHDTASSRMRSFKHWLSQPLVGVNFSGGPASPPPAQTYNDGFGDGDSSAQNFSYAPPPDDASMSTPQPGDYDYAPPRPEGLTVLTQPRGGDGYGAPSSRSFGMTERGNCWWLTF